MKTNQPKEEYYNEVLDFIHSGNYSIETKAALMAFALKISQETKEIKPDSKGWEEELLKLELCNNDYQITKEFIYDLLVDQKEQTKSKEVCCCQCHNGLSTMWCYKCRRNHNEMEKEMNDIYSEGIKLGEKQTK
jgi:hypothetical protein